MDGGGPRRRGAAGAARRRRGHGRRADVGRPGRRRQAPARRRVHAAGRRDQRRRRGPAGDGHRAARHRPARTWRAPTSTPDPFSPNGDGQDDVTQISYTPAEAVQARLSVVDGDGTVLRRLTAWARVTAAAQKVKWDGRVLSGGKLAPAPEGSATRPGRDPRHGRQHRPTVRRKVTVDRTLALGARLARHVLAQRRRRERRRHALVQADPRGRRDGHRASHGGSAVRTLRARAARRGQAVGDLGRQARRGRDGHERRATPSRLTADGALGVTSAAQVGHRRPRRPARDGARHGARGVPQDREDLLHAAKDAYSPMVKVGATVTNAAGTVVATLDARLGQAGRRPRRAPGSRVRAAAYTVTFTAVDLGGNHLARAGGDHRQGALRRVAIRGRRCERPGHLHGDRGGRRAARVTCGPALRRDARARSRRAASGRSGRSLPRCRRRARCGTHRSAPRRPAQDLPEHLDPFRSYAASGTDRCV